MAEARDATDAGEEATYFVSKIGSVDDLIAAGKFPEADTAVIELAGELVASDDFIASIRERTKKIEIGYAQMCVNG